VNLVDVLRPAYWTLVRAEGTKLRVSDDDVEGLRLSGVAHPSRLEGRWGDEAAVQGLELRLVALRLERGLCHRVLIDPFLVMFLVDQGPIGGPVDVD